MRLQMLSLSIAALLASSGAAMAVTGYDQPLVVPGDSGQNHQSDAGPRIPERHYRYLMRLETLHEKLLRLKVQDGGQLSADHEAGLRRQLDKLNRIYRNG